MHLTGLSAIEGSFGNSLHFFLFFCINVTPSNDLDKSTNERQSTPFWGVIFKCLAICLF